jgi:hypothetical protein
LMMSKMWLMVYHPFQRQDGGATLPPETKEKLFITSLENIEYSILLETEARTMKWGWLFKTYMQWHALAFILSELCHRTSGDMVERAWVAVEATREGRWDDRMSEANSRGHLWRPLQKLYRKAKDARKRGLQEEQLVKHRVAGAAPTRTYSPNANPMFGHPKIPTVVRAPLSQAQLQRFTQGPVYGQRPLDSHELLKSPRLTIAANAEIDPMDMAPIPEETRSIYGHAPRGSVSSTSAFSQRNAQIARPLAQHPSARPNGHTSALSNARVVDFAEPFARSGHSLDYGSGNMDLQPNNTPAPSAVIFSANPANGLPFPGTAGAAQQDALSHQTRIPSIDSNGFDPAMDTSGDLDWENWDQLVRQFGMDVDSGEGVESSSWEFMGGGGGGQGLVGNTGAGIGGVSGGGIGAAPAGQQSYRMGPGTGGGDWF